MFHAVRANPGSFPSNLSRTTVVLCALLAAQPATAANFAFTGTRENVTRPPVPNTGRCAPTYPRTIVIEPGALSSTGTSNFGAFTASMSHCEATDAALRDIIDGLFTFNFAAGDSLFGSYSGQATPGGPQGSLNILHNFVITGGSGRFLDAIGTFVSTGTLRGAFVDGGPAGIFSGSLNGIVNAPGVPEPASWAMMIGGFALAGAAARRRPHPAPCA
jgi:hypothetical protein